jgi:hypothetical protein
VDANQALRQKLYEVRQIRARELEVLRESNSKASSGGTGVAGGCSGAVGSGSEAAPLVQGGDGSLLSAQSAVGTGEGGGVQQQPVPQGRRGWFARW